MSIYIFLSFLDALSVLMLIVCTALTLFIKLRKNNLLRNNFEFGKDRVLWRNRKRVRPIFENVAFSSTQARCRYEHVFYYNTNNSNKNTAL